MTDNTILVTLCDDPCSFGEINLSEFASLKATWKARIEEHLSYLNDDGYEIDVRYGSRTKVEGPSFDIEHRVRQEIDACWEAWCADGCTV